jgi:lysyl-tRNA synthetase class 2
MSENEYQSEAEVRLERLNIIKQKGILPYPGTTDRTKEIGEALADFTTLESSQEKIILAGRIRAIRLHGGSCFGQLQDDSGAIQFYFKEDVLGKENYKFFTDTFDVGDFMEVTGVCYVTKRGEKSLLADSFKLLGKALLPLPEKWHGLTDIEVRFRKRYLDLLANPDVKEIFLTRHKIIQFIRKTLLNEGFLEVETPILQPVASGAIARPFKTHHNALDIDMYLRIAPEIYLKELVVGGMDKVFEIARCFRNEGIDYSHNPEFTQVEFYWAYKNYNDLMNFMEKFLSEMVTEVCGSSEIDYDGQKINFAGPYERVDFREALIKEAGIDLDEYDSEQLVAKAKELGLKPDKSWGKGKTADELYKKFVRPKLINPTYIINHPLELSPLAKKMPDRPNYVERFQLVVGGKIELVNAFSELNDPLDQEERFAEQGKLTDKGDDEAMLKDDEFVEALKYGLPPTAGLGMGIDRLVSILTNTHNIKEVILFPTLKPENTEEKNL